MIRRTVLRLGVTVLVSGAMAAAILGARMAGAFPVTTDTSGLPAGSVLNDTALDEPSEVFHSDAIGGQHSYLVNLGEMAFNSPAIFGGAARQANLSCNTCHQNGSGNGKLFVPGLSTRPGNFDTTSALFQPKADNHVLDPVTPPSLRGVRDLAPYGHDGREASLRDFIRNVIVNEFAGAEPSPALLDGLVTYLRDIDFLPNPRITSDGRLKKTASASEKRGEALFNRPFPGNTSLSCAACHQPSSAFTDHRQHDIGSGGLIKTPTLLDADFNAPYFHDGRFDTYEQVVNYFDHAYVIHFGKQDHRDLVAYLTAIGDAAEPLVRDSVARELDKAERFTSILAVAIPAQDRAVVDLTAATVHIELRQLKDAFPDRNDTTISGGTAERDRARSATSDLSHALDGIAQAADSGDTAGAQKQYDQFRAQLAAAKPILGAAENWSLFNPEIRAAYSSLPTNKPKP